MEDPILIGANKDVSPFESEACEKYLKSFQLNLEEIVPLTEPKESKADLDQNQSVEASSAPTKIQSRRPTLEINGVQVKPKTLAEYREAIKRKSLDDKISDEIVNDENKSRTKNVRRHTTESPVVTDKKNVKVLGEHCNKKTAKSNSNLKSPKVKEEPNNENTVTRSGRVSKKVLKVENVKEKHKKQEDEENDDHTEAVSRKASKHSPDSDYFPNSFLRPDCKVDVEAVDTKVVMYTGAGRHLHSYAIHNYNLLTENTFDVSAWQRDFALTALNNNIDSSGRSIFRSTVPLVSKKLIHIKNDLKEGKIDCKLTKTELVRNEKLPNRCRRRKKKKAVWTKQKTHSIPVQNAKKMKEDSKDVSMESEKDDDLELELSTDKEDRIETSPQQIDEVTTLKRKLNPNEEDDLYWEMYGTPHKRVKLKLIQTKSDSNKKPQWTSVNYEKENRPEETEEEMSGIVSTVMDNMLNYVELNHDYNEKDVTLDPTYFEEYKLENEESADTPKQLKRKRNNSSRVKWELKRLDVLIFEHESESNKNGDGTCSNDFCKLGCICESISVRPKNIAINHCSEINCIFKCVCPAPRRNDHKPPIRDESEIIRSVAEKRNGRNLAKKEKEWIQTLVKTNDEYIIMQSSSGNKNKREVKKPERYREESLHWENVAHQKFIYEKVKRNLREKAKKANNGETSQVTEEDDAENPTVKEESSTVTLRDKQRAEIKLLKRLRKKKRLQMEMLQQQQQQQQSDENKPNKTSPFKFYFCKEHMVLDCKCKAKKDMKEEDNEQDKKLKALEEEISALTSNLGNLSSKEKDRLLSLMREKQTLTESRELSKVGETESKDEVVIPGSGTDEEYIDLNTLSKFIPHPDEDKANADQDPSDVKNPVDNPTEAKAVSSEPSQSLQPQEMNKDNPEEGEEKGDDDVEVLDSGTAAPSNATGQQGLPHLSLNSIQSLINQKAPFTNATKLSIDFYGFMLHNGIGYLPISQYSPNQLYMIFKDPTKRDPLPIIFHGPDYLQKASTWANGFLQGYVRFHPKSQNPCWKIIKFSNMQELRNWKLFDFKFLKDYSPMVLTDEGMYKVKGKILYKLLLLPRERTFKFKQVMEAKLDMDDISFIEKYEYFHNCRDNLPNNKPIRFIQRLQLLDENEPRDIPVPSAMCNVVVSDITGPSENRTPGDVPIPKVSPSAANLPTILPNLSPNAVNPPSILPKPSTNAATHPSMLPNLSLNAVSNILPKPSPSTSTVQHKPTVSPALHSGGIFIKPSEALLQRPTRPVTASQALHRQNIINNLNRLAMSRMKSTQGASAAMGVGPGVNPGGMANSGFPAQAKVPGSNAVRGMLGNIQRPRVAPVAYMAKKPPPPYPGMNHLNPAVVKVDNLERYKQFIQISDLVTTQLPAQTTPPTVQTSPLTAQSGINKSHPILSKSLATPSLPTSDAPVCIERLAPGSAKPDSDIESNLDTFRITKMSISPEDSNNNRRDSPSPRKYIQPKRNLAMQGSNQRISTNPMNAVSLSMNSPLPRTSNSPITTIPRTAISSMTSISPMGSFQRSSSSPLNSSHVRTSISPMTSNSPMTFASPMPPTSPKRAPPVPGLKPIKKPLPGLKAINPAGFASSAPPSKKLTEEVDISMSPVKNQDHRDAIGRLSSSESESTVEGFPHFRAPPTSELSIVECITRMDHTPITITPNGEDTVTISPIVMNTNSNNSGGVKPYKEKMGATVFERLSAVKRLNDGESLETVARSMNVSENTVSQWLRNFERLQKRTGHRAMMSGGVYHAFGTPES